MTEVEQVTSGIDWVSCTLVKNADGYHEWRRNVHQAIEKVAREGYTISSRRLLGYEGVSCGNCFIGENEQGSFAQFTGEKADWAYDATTHPMAHYSRVDVQTSVKYREYQANIGKKAYRDSIRANETLPAGRKRKIWIIVGSDGGDTVYIGSASSNQRCRIYNKERQSDDIRYTRTWRYEVVFRNELATAFAQNLSAAPINRAEYCLATCIGWGASRGIDVSSLGSGAGVVLPLQRTLPTDVERKLHWLSTQVRPTVEYLCKLGFRDTLLETLLPLERED